MSAIPRCECRLTGLSKSGSLVGHPSAQDNRPLPVTSTGSLARVWVWCSVRFFAACRDKSSFVPGGLVDGPSVDARLAWRQEMDRQMRSEA